MEFPAEGGPIAALALGHPACVVVWRGEKATGSLKPWGSPTGKAWLAVRGTDQPGFSARAVPLPGRAVCPTALAQQLPGFAVGEKPFVGRLLCLLTVRTGKDEGSRPLGGSLKGEGGVNPHAGPRAKPRRSPSRAAHVPEGLYLNGGLLPEEGVREPLGREEFWQFQGPNSEAGSRRNPLQRTLSGFPPLGNGAKGLMELKIPIRTQAHPAAQHWEEVLNAERQEGPSAIAGWSQEACRLRINKRMQLFGFGSEGPQ